jgi:RNA polymerase sigma-70 factor, ECF subfamily
VAIHAFLISLMPGDPAADDVLQQTNITPWRKRETYHSGTHFRSWAFECAKWTLRAHLKEFRPAPVRLSSFLTMPQALHPGRHE